MTPGDEEQWTVSVQHTEDDIQHVRRRVRRVLPGVDRVARTRRDLRDPGQAADREGAGSGRAGPAGRPFASQGLTMDEMHRYTDETDAFSRAIVAYARNRIASAQPLDGSATGAELASGPARRSRPKASEARRPCVCGARCSHPRRSPPTTPRRWRSCPAPPRRRRCCSTSWSGSSSTIAAGWIDGAGAIWAENQALAMARRSGGVPGRCGRGLRERRLGRQPLRARGGPSPRDATARRTAGGRVEDRRGRERALLGRHRRPRDGRGDRRGARRRTRAAHR